MKRAVIYDMGNGKEEVFDIGNDPQNEIDERASIANEERSKEGPAFISYQFKWVEDDYPTVHTK